MRRLRQLILLAVSVAAVLLPLDWYVYWRGGRDEVARYKRSRQFQMTLDSMYRFGLMDGCTDDEKCDKAGFTCEEGGHR